MSKTYLPVASPTAKHTHLEVAVRYEKGKGLVASLALLKVKRENGFTSISFEVFATPTKNFVLEPWKRDNKKKTEEAFERVVADVKAGTGPVAAGAAELLADVGGLAVETVAV